MDNDEIMKMVRRCNLEIDRLAEENERLSRELQELSDAEVFRNIDGVIAWADGIRSALDSEFSGRVTEKEANIAGVILKACEQEEDSK